MTCVTAWYKLQVRRSTTGNAAAAAGRVSADVLDHGQDELKTFGIPSEIIQDAQTVPSESPLNTAFDFSSSGALRYPDAEIMESGRIRRDE